MRKAEGVDDKSRAPVLVPSGTTLLWLMTHISHAERLWIVHRFAGEDLTGPDSTVQPGATLTGAFDAYPQTSGTRSDAIVAASDFDDMTRRTGDESPVNLRWVLMHLLEGVGHAGPTWTSSASSSTATPVADVPAAGAPVRPRYASARRGARCRRGANGYDDTTRVSNNVKPSRLATAEERRLSVRITL